jgi:lysophospholipase L1-like esterase
VSRAGLVALGDSITNGDVAPMLGVRAWSWAQWLASALELPYTGLAVNGARAADLVRHQLPRLDGPYAVAALWIGVNDVRAGDVDLDAYAADLRVAVDAAVAAAQRLVLVTIPLDLGRPRAGAAKVGAANACIAGEAARVGAALVDLAALRGWRLVAPDGVHLTALGELELADRAAAALGAAVLPSALAQPDRSLAGAVGYAVSGHAAAVARDARRRLAEAAARRVRR